MSEEITDVIFKQLDKLEVKLTIGFEGVHKRQDYANGKVNKIVLALAVAFGLIIGLGFKEAGVLLSLL